MPEKDTIISFKEPASDRRFYVARDGDTVHLSYWAWFDRSTNEEISIDAHLPFEDYKSGIEALLEQGRCEVEHEDSGMQLLSKGSSTIMTLRGMDKTVVGVNLPLAPSLFLCKQTYTVSGVEEVYDAFDEFEHSNALPSVAVKAVSIDDAIAKARKILYDNVYQVRKQGGYLSSGSFIATVTEVRDEKGKVLYSEEPRS